MKLYLAVLIGEAAQTKASDTSEESYSRAGLTIFWIPIGVMIFALACLTVSDCRTICVLRRSMAREKRRKLNLSSESSDEEAPAKRLKKGKQKRNKVGDFPVIKINTLSQTSSGDESQGQHDHHPNLTKTGKIKRPKFINPYVKSKVMSQRSKSKRSKSKKSRKGKKKSDRKMSLLSDSSSQKSGEKHHTRREFLEA
jgi:hypothetical protein